VVCSKNKTAPLQNGRRAAEKTVRRYGLMALFGSSAVPVGPLAMRPRIAPGLPLSERTKFYMLSSRLCQALFLCQQINQELPDKRNRDSGICKQEETNRRVAGPGSLD
jgi:hypothetical protein